MTRKLSLAVLATVAALAAPGIVQAAPMSYTDPAGDNGSAADIGVVTVQLAADGYIHVRPTIANQPAIMTPGAILIGFDTDRSLATGGPGGLDYFFIFLFEDLSGALLRWDGSDWAEADAQQGDVRYLVGSSGFELLIRPAVLGGATAFNFKVVAGTGAADQPLDHAPDQGTWLFEAIGPAVVEDVDATFVPAAPRAGRVFQVPVVRVTLSDGTTIIAPSYRCVAQLSGKLLRGTGRGGCTFRLPKSAKGKRLLVTLFVTYKGATDKFKPYVFKVR